MSKEMEEIKVMMLLTSGLMIVSGWVWKFFPTAAYPDYLWIKQDAGTMTWIFSGLALMYLAMFAFGLLAEIFQIYIWELEKRFIRRFKRRIHWSVGMLASFAISIGAMLLALSLGIATFDLEALFALRGGLWPILGVLAILVTGTSFGWSMFLVHARIANSLNRNAPPFMV